MQTPVSSCSSSRSALHFSPSRRITSSASESLHRQQPSSSSFTLFTMHIIKKLLVSKKANGSCIFASRLLPYTLGKKHACACACRGAEASQVSSSTQMGGSARHYARHPPGECACAPFKGALFS